MAEYVIKVKTSYGLEELPIKPSVSGAASTIASDNLTASRALISDSNGKVAVSPVTSTELGYLDGVTSNIQTQLNGKAPNVPYLPLSGGSMNSSADVTWTKYNRKMIVSGNDITFDPTADTGTYAGSIMQVKHSAGTTAAIGVYGNYTNGLSYIYMGGTYSDPDLKMSPDGQFTFKNRPKVGAYNIAMTSDIPTVPSSLKNPYSLTFGSKTYDGSSAQTITASDLGAITSHQNISGKLDKITYEWNKEFAAGSNGAISLGRYYMYDTNLTFDISTTTSTCYNATLVIATQNGSIRQAKVYGDPSNAITPLLKICKSATSSSRCYVEVFCNFPGWSKNIVHIKAVALGSSSVTNQMASVTWSNTPTTVSDTIYTDLINDSLSVLGNKSNKSETISALSMVDGKSILYTKGDGNIGYLNIQETAFNTATTTTNGLMSSTDKSRVDDMWNIWSADDTTDTLVNKVKEVLAVFENYPEGNNLVTALSGKLSTTGGTLTGSLTLPENVIATRYSVRDGWNASQWHTSTGDEAMIFQQQNPRQSWIFRYATDTTAFTSITPTMQIKNGGVAINKMFATGTTAPITYNLDVNGTANATTIYENGIPLFSKYALKGSYATTEYVDSAISTAITTALNASY